MTDRQKASRQTTEMGAAAPHDDSRNISYLLGLRCFHCFVHLQNRPPEAFAEKYNSPDGLVD